MRVLSFASVSTLVAASTVGTGTAFAQDASNNLRAIIDAREIPVTIDNFVRAATDIEFGKYLAIAGGVNTLVHIREPVPIDQQPTIRMNRDVIYSMAVINISEGAVLRLPDVGERYMSAHVVNQDHYMNEVFVGGGDHVLDLATFDTPYVVVIIRTLVDASDPEDLAAAHALQDAIGLTAGASDPLIIPDYDEESFQGVLNLSLIHI